MMISALLGAVGGVAGWHLSSDAAERARSTHMRDLALAGLAGAGLSVALDRLVPLAPRGR